MLGTTAIQISARACKYQVGIAILFAALLPLLSDAQQSSAHKNHAPAPAPSSSLLQAEQLIQSGQLDQARNVIDEEIRRDPSNLEAYNLLGIIFTNEKNYTEALDAFQQALKLNPNSTSTHNNLGNLYVAQEKPDLAEKEFNRVLQIAPANRDANYNLGLLLLANGSPLPAIAHFQRVHPQTIETQFNLVRAFFAAGKSVQALQLRPPTFRGAKVRRSTAFHSRRSARVRKQYQSAQREFEMANALKPDTFEILHNLGQAYLRAREYAKAELALNHALKLKPDSAETLYLLAQGYSDQSRPVDALELLVRAHKLAPENTDIIFLMARVSMTQNYFEDAIPLLESGLKIAPTTRRPARRPRRKLLHVGQSRESDRGIQNADRTRSFGPLLRFHGTFVSPPRPLR